MRFAPLAVAFVLAWTSSVFAAGKKSSPEPDTYIFDVLVLQPYKGSFGRLVKGDGVPDWVKAISTSGEGTAVPSKMLDIGGTPYRLDHVCKPHDCAGNTLDVLWAPLGHKVWAALVDGGKPMVLLGSPLAPQAKALTDPAASAAAAGSATPTPATASASTAPAPTPAAPAPVAAAPPPPEPATYLFDLLPLQPYKGNLARLVKSKGTPDWVRAISVKGEGTAVPSKTVDIAGTSYRLDHVCKPHDCAGNTLDVLWAPAGRKVWAALVDRGKPAVMLGNPPAPQAKALSDAVAAAAITAPAAAAPPTGSVLVPASPAQSPPK